jgi:hypothetical protein
MIAPSDSTVPLPSRVAGRRRSSRTISAAAMSRSIARASPTASSSRASGERAADARDDGGAFSSG